MAMTILCGCRTVQPDIVVDPSLRLLCVGSGRVRLQGNGNHAFDAFRSGFARVVDPGFTGESSATLDVVDAELCVNAKVEITQISSGQQHTENLSGCVTLSADNRRCFMHGECEYFD
jgi:hypothetical protein